MCEFAEGPSRNGVPIIIKIFHVESSTFLKLLLKILWFLIPSILSKFSRFFLANDLKIKVLHQLGFSIHRWFLDSVASCLIWSTKESLGALVIWSKQAGTILPFFSWSAIMVGKQSKMFLYLNFLLSSVFGLKECIGLKKYKRLRWLVVREVGFTDSINHIFT